MSFHPQTSRIAATLACSLTLLLTAETRARESTTVPSGIEPFNFGQVNPGYFRGSELKGPYAKALAARGVRTIVDLRSDGDYTAAEAGLVADAGMKYVRIPMTTRIAPTAEQISTFLAVVTDAANQPVYVHCVEGRHRTGVMTAVYRMTVDGWTADRAFSEMKDYRFGVDFLHPEFKKFVYAYRPPAREDTAQPSAVVATIN